MDSKQRQGLAQFMENHYDFDMSFNFNGFDSNPLIQKFHFGDVKAPILRIIEAVIVGAVISIVSVVIAKKVKF